VKKLLSVTALALLCATAVTACGGSPAETSAAVGSSADCTAAANSVVAAGRADVAPFLPTAPVDASKVKGKTVWLIQNSVTPLVTAVTKGMTDAGERVGVTVKAVSGEGSIPTIVSAVSQAVAQKADGIVLLAIAPTAVAAQVAEAKGAGIPVVDTYNSNVGTDMSADGFFGHVSADYAAGGKMIAAWMMADSSCNLDAAILGNAALAPHKAQSDAAQAEFKEMCGGPCKSDFETLDLPKLATSSGPQVQQVLRRNPDMKYVYSNLDGAVTFIAPAIQQAGNADVKVASMGGDTASLERIRSGDSVQKSVVAIAPQMYQGYAFMDQIMRGMTGAPAVDWTLPIRFVDSSNVGASDADIFPRFAGVEDSFAKLWGVS
jgi:ABC-type sugar transport system substrate-binding protein